MTKSSIEWTGETWNPVRGCTRVSPGCEHCYAEAIAARFSGKGMAYEGLAEYGPQGPRWTRQVRLVPELLTLPLRWKTPRLVFVNSMSDLFHESLPFEVIGAVFGVMAQTPRHTYQVLTKRETRMWAFFAWLKNIEEDHGPDPETTVTTLAANLVDIDQIARPWPLANVILGVSVENQEYADKRLPVLAALKRSGYAAKTMASYEPALGPVVFGEHLPDWVIFGGESGAGARAAHLEWAESALAECRARGKAFFMKQMGKNAYRNGTRVRTGAGKGNEASLFPAHLLVRENP